MIKDKIYRLVEKGSHGSRINLYFDYGIIILIVMNVVAVVLETIAPYKDEWSIFFKYFEYWKKRTYRPPFTVFVRPCLTGSERPPLS